MLRDAAFDLELFLMRDYLKRLQHLVGFKTKLTPMEHMQFAKAHVFYDEPYPKGLPFDTSRGYIRSNILHNSDGTTLVF